MPNDASSLPMAVPLKHLSQLLVKQLRDVPGVVGTATVTLRNIRLSLEVDGTVLVVFGDGSDELTIPVEATPDTEVLDVG